MIGVDLRRAAWASLCVAITLCGCHSLGTAGTCTRARSGAPPSQHPAQPDAAVDVFFLKAGGGDAAVVDYGSVEVVIDGGSCRRCLARFLRERSLVEGPPGDQHIELVILSHADPDHYRGLRGLAQDFVIDELWDPGYERGRALSGPRGYRKALASLREALARSSEGAGEKRPLQCHHQPIVHDDPAFRALQSVPGAGVAFEVGDALRLRLLHSEMAPTTVLRGNGVVGIASREAYRINNSSIVIALEYLGGRQVLFSGDINGRVDRTLDRPAEVEAQLLAQGASYLASDVLKVPHHGSDSASTSGFVDAVDPSVAVLMPHRWLRRFGPPATRVLEQYQTRPGTRLLRPSKGHPVHCQLDAAGAHCELL